MATPEIPAFGIKKGSIEIFTAAPITGTADDHTNCPRAWAIPVRKAVSAEAGTESHVIRATKTATRRASPTSPGVVSLSRGSAKIIPAMEIKTVASSVKLRTEFTSSQAELSWFLASFPTKSGIKTETAELRTTATIYKGRVMPARYASIISVAPKHEAITT